MLLITFLNDHEFVVFFGGVHSVKWYQVLLCFTNYSIRHSFVYTQLNDQTVPFQIIQFSISHLFALSLNAKQCYLTHSGPKLTKEQL